MHHLPSFAGRFNLLLIPARPRPLAAHAKNDRLGAGQRVHHLPSFAAYFDPENGLTPHFPVGARGRRGRQAVDNSTSH